VHATGFEGDQSESSGRKNNFFDTLAILSRLLLDKRPFDELLAAASDEKEKSSSIVSKLEERRGKIVVRIWLDFNRSNVVNGQFLTSKKQK
jgi:hypothetical protein